MGGFIFRSKEVSHDVYWITDECLGFDFGCGEFTDEEGDAYYIHCEYDMCTKEFIFEILWNDERAVIENNSLYSKYLNDDEKQYLQKHMLKYC